MISTISNSFGSLVLFADAVRTKFSWDRIEKNTDWILPVVVLVIAAFFVRKWYERDARELGRGIGWFLTIMRTLVFVGLFLVYLKPEWRTETERRIESRVAILADTSLSMGLTDSADGNAGATRSEEITKLFEKSDLIKELRQTHNVDIYTFGDTLKTVTTLKKFSDEAGQEDSENREGTEDGSAEPEKPIDWKAVLKPVAGETRLGDSMNQLLDEIRDKPIAGVLVPTDGGYNAGADPAVTSVELADESKIKLFPIGVGSNVLPPNVRVSQLVVPPRVQLGDKYTVLGYIQSRGMQGANKTVRVELFMKDENTDEKPVLVDRQDVTLEEDGKKIPVKFERTPATTGHWAYTLRIVPPSEDRYPADDAVEAQFEIVDRPLRVLLFAGGPMREYQFMRNLLHRDKGIEVDVLIQSAKDKIYQDAHKVLYAFPETAQELSQYDCIVAFDPDWRKLSDHQIRILERWVSRFSGGLILFAGPVNAGERLNGWVQDPRTSAIRDMYPVIFQRNYIAGEGREGNIDSLTPIFSREGKEADFLSLSDDTAESRKLWSEFEGFYASLPVEGKKPSATVYARYSPSLPASDQRIYFAGQFYGSGRVFYAGSAELWRLRGIGEKYHERIITKLVRHVTQGRLLSDSPRGKLIIEREQYMPGDTIEIEANLNNANMDPLTEDKVRMELTLPDGTVEEVNLVADENEKGKGKFLYRLPVTAEGNYKITVIMPDDESVRVERRFQVKMPDLEREDPVRKDDLLGYLAEATKGKYYLAKQVGTNEGVRSLVDALPDQTKTIVLTSRPDTNWEREWLLWMMILLVGLLAIEWTIRRLLKLA